MNDVMVTARMSVEKKTEGSRILKSLGVTASNAVNQLFDYIVEHKRLPFGAPVESGTVSPERWENMQEWVKGFPYVELSPEFRDMDRKQAKGHRLRASGAFEGL